MKVTSRLGLALVLCALASCISVPKFDVTVSPRPDAGTAPSTPPSASPSAAGKDAQLFLEKAQEALDNNHLTEAIKAYISIMAIADQDPGPETKAAAEKALTELTRIGTRLSIEPNEAWLDPNGKQLTESTRAVGRENSRQPAVYLYENFGTGKTPIADAPISFEFIKNSGAMNAFANTDSFGRANANLLKLDSGADSAIIRATPVFKSRGFTYAFKSVFLDFSYLPPSNTLLAMSLSESELGVEANSLAADVLAPELKAVGLQVAPSSGGAQREAFMAAYQGDGAAVSSLLSSSGASYLLLVYIDVDSIRQIEYNGKLYNLFSAYGKAAMRLIASDGTIVHTIPIEGLKGDGGNKADSVKKAYAQAQEALLSRLREELPQLRKALQGK